MSGQNPAPKSSKDLRNPTGTQALPPDQLRDQVIQLAESEIGKDLLLFPCRFVFKNGKDALIPCLGGWKKDDLLTNDPKRITELLDRYQGAAFGSRCDNLFVFDVDKLNGENGPRTEPNHWISTLSEAEREALETGLKATSPSAGDHYIFRRPENAGELGLEPLIGMAEGVDLLTGSGKIVVLPPSYVEKRERGYCGCYSFDNEFDPDRPLPELPQVLIDLILRNSKKKAGEKTNSPPEQGALIPYGQRRKFLLKRSRFLRGQGLPFYELFAALKATRDSRCSAEPEPVSDEEVRGIAKTAVEKFEPDQIEEVGPLRIMSAAQFKLIPLPMFVIKGVIPSGVTVVYSDPGVGKSFLCLEIGSCVARNEPLFRNKKFEVNRPGTVLFALPEGSASWADRLRCYDTHHFFDDSPRMRFIRDGVNLFSDQGWERLNEAFQQICDEEGAPPVLIVIDTLAAATPGANENSIEDIGLVMNRLQTFVTRGSNVLLSHHSNKAGNYRGHSAIAGSCDAMLFLSKDAGTGILELTARKLRDADSISTCSFEIKKTNLGPVPLGTTTLGPWGRFEMTCEEHPGLLSALESHGLLRPGIDQPTDYQNDFALGIALRKIQSDWNKSNPPMDRAHRARRTRVLLKLHTDLVSAGVIQLKTGSLKGKQADALDAVVFQPAPP